jgi:Rrf2 family protein
MIVGTMPKQVEYALMALADMQSASPGRLFSARELCDAHGVPFDVMSKTLQRLAHAGILRSVKGKSGGYQVIKDLSTVSLLGLMEAVLGEVATVHCLKNGCTCSLAERCNVSGPMKILDRKLRNLYAGISLAELIKSSE